MSNNIKRYLVPATGPDVSKIELALLKLESICEELGGNKDAILLIPTKNNLRGTSLETALGKDVADALYKGKSVKLNSGGNLKLETERTFRGLWRSDIILGVYVTKKMLNMIDDAKDAKAVIVVPWNIKDVKEWQMTWNPILIGESENKSSPKKLIENPVVEEALKTLTKRVNLSTGLSHPSDRDAAIELFRILLKNNELFDPVAIRAWAIRNGWTSEGADELKDIAEGVLKGKRYRVSPYSSWAKDIIEQLRDAAKTDKNKLIESG